MAEIAERRLPWEGISAGHASRDELLTSQEMLQRSGLDWDVCIRPLWRRMSDGIFIQHPKAKEVYRTDTEDTLGTVRGHYHPFANREAFAFGDALVEGGDGHWAEAGMQLDGARVFMTMKIGDGFRVLDQDAYDMYVFIRTGHDGYVSISASVVPFRVSCLNQNQIVLARRRTSWTIQHTSSVKTRVAEARRSLAITKEYADEFTRVAEQLAARKISQHTAEDLIDSVIPEKRSRRAVMISEILARYRTSPTVAPYRGTAYGLLNSLTEYMDHFRRQRSPNARFESTMWGEAARARNALAVMMSEM
jgi:phage/plasmid-like protein (TIGR03299 family)